MATQQQAAQHALASQVARASAQTDAEAPAETESPEAEDAAEPEAEVDAAPAEGEVETTEGQEGETPPDGEEPPAEGDAKPEVEAKPLTELTVEELAAQLTEEQLQRVAMKYSNRTMAAARKAERAVEEVRTQNRTLASENTVYRGFVDQFQSDPMGALRRIPGWQGLTFRQFAEKVGASKDGGGDPKPVDPEVAELKKWKADQEREKVERARAETHRADVARVAEALGKEPDRFDLVLNDIGQSQLWDAINAYREMYGRVPNDKVFEMADAVERRLEASLSKSRKFSPSSGAKASTPTAGNGHAAGSRTAKPKTITNRASSGAPAIPDYSKLTEAERDRRILEDMRAAGEL
jgi:hypothetical protein